MAAKSSEARRKKRLEKKRAKRKEKLKAKLRREHIPLRELPLHQTFLNADWRETRYARVLVSRRHPEGTYAVCEFLVDLDGFGLRDCFAPRRIPLEALEDFIQREERIKAPADLCSALVHEGVKWAQKYRFPLPKETRKALEILPEPGECPVEFGRDGEPFLRGEEADIRQRVRQSGHRLEDFECELFPEPPKEKRCYFVTEEYLREGDRNDPLVRLERLAALSDRYEATGDLERTEELHRTMEELAEESNRLPDFLRYRAQFLIRQERMDAALQVFERIVEATEDTKAKALARLDLADFTRYLGDALAADEIYQKVIRENPDLLEARLRYAAFLYRAARREEGKEKYRELIAELKGREDAREHLQRAYQELYDILRAEGEKAEAKALYKEAKREEKLRLK